MGVLIYGVLFFSAPYVAAFYEQPILINIIRVYCLTFIVSGFSSVQLAILNKQMRFREIMLWNIPGTLVGITIGISMAYSGYGVWSIVWMYLSSQIIQSLVMWLFSSWKPNFCFCMEKAKYHYGFGYKLMLSGLLDTVFKNIYNVLIGKFFSIQSLGYYERAKSFNEYPVTILTTVINKVTYPLLAQIQNDKERISDIYKQILQFTFFITAPLMFCGAGLAKPLFLLVLGEEWLPAVPFFKILCIAAIFYPVHVFNINIFKVYGRSDLFLKLEVIKKIVIVCSIIVSFNFGIIGLVWSSVFTSCFALIINMYYSGQMISYPTHKQILDMLPILISAGLMAGIIMVLISLLNNYNLYLQISISAFAGVIVYLGINYLIKSRPLMFTIQLLKDLKI